MYRREGGSIELQADQLMPWTALRFLARDPGTFQPSKHDASPKPTANILRPLNLTEPMTTKEQFAGSQRSSHALPRLPPFGPSHRPAPQPAMAQRSTQQPGTWNLSPPTHPSSSVCDEDLGARGHTQACSSILFTCILTLFTQHLFNPHSPYSSWSLGTSCRSPFIGADLPLLPLFLPPHSYSSLFALAFHPYTHCPKLFLNNQI